MQSLDLFAHSILASACLPCKSSDAAISQEKRQSSPKGKQVHTLLFPDPQSWFCLDFRVHTQDHLGSGEIWNFMPFPSRKFARKLHVFSLDEKFRPTFFSCLIGAFVLSLFPKISPPQLSTFRTIAMIPVPKKAYWFLILGHVQNSMHLLRHEN